MRQLALTVALLAALTAPLDAQRARRRPQPRPIPTPASVLGFVPGTERRLVEWDSIARYFTALDAASDRVSVRELGRTTNGAPFLAVFVSSPANLARLPALMDAQRRLADPRLIRDSVERARLEAQARVFVLMTSSIHSTEVGGHFAPLEIAWRLATAATPAQRTVLDNAVLMLVPSMNPDGVTIVSRWYNETLATPSEGAGPPQLYHHYTGHDNNRDWYAFTQVETQMVVDSLYGVWHPQVTMDIHQQGPAGARLFIPPYMDPVEPNVDPLIVQGVNALGTEIARRLTADGFAGISINSTYDAWTPARAFQHYNGAVRILTETASAELATSITMPWDSLRPGRGFDSRTPSWNFVMPWRGGRWTLADIVRYQTAGAMAMLEHVAQTREQWVRQSRLVSERAVAGWPDWPYAFVIPTANQDQAALATLLEILARAQVEVRQALQPFTLAGERHSPGTYVVVLRQPYASFAKAVLERQDYPDLREYPGGPPRRPYDVTAHTLPLLLGVRALASRESLDVDLSAPAAAPRPSYRVAGLSSADARQRPAVRVGIYRSYAASMDEGWTRWLFDTWAVPYVSLEDSVVRAGSLGGRFDVIVLPDQSPRGLAQGLAARRYPARYAGGLGTAGGLALREFVDGGGTLVAFNDASDYAIGALELPVTNVLDGISPREFYAPGTILRVRYDTESPLAAGLGAEGIAWYESGPAFDVVDPAHARVVARYPASAPELLLSGWLLGPQHIVGKAALVEVRRGRGRVVLFGFRPQYRGQSQATFPLIWNALRTAARER